MKNAQWTLAGEKVEARAAGTLWWPAGRMLAVGDLHLGRPAAAAARGEPFLPPYGDDDTLNRLEAEIAATAPCHVVLVGDSFDDCLGAVATAAAFGARLAALAEGRTMTWIAGNHDPRPVAGLPGRWAGALALGPVDIRHIAATAAPPEGRAEISAHFHPRAEIWRRGARVRRRCFLADTRRAILPAFGTYTGGLDVRDPCMRGLVGDEAAALMIGKRVVPVPLARLG
ncbi:MAG: ligase-associated DNA damage response endonuclease PdeM [Pseudomonadota bacterium]